MMKVLLRLSMMLGDVRSGHCKVISGRRAWRSASHDSLTSDNLAYHCLPYTN